MTDPDEHKRPFRIKWNIGKAPRIQDLPPPDAELTGLARAAILEHAQRKIERREKKRRRAVERAAQEKSRSLREYARRLGGK